MLERLTKIVFFSKVLETPFLATLDYLTCRGLVITVIKRWRQPSNVRTVNMQRTVQKIAKRNTGANTSQTVSGQTIQYMDCLDYVSKIFCLFLDRQLHAITDSIMYVKTTEMCCGAFRRHQLWRKIYYSPCISALRATCVVLKWVRAIWYSVRLVHRER